MFGATSSAMGVRGALCKGVNDRFSKNKKPKFPRLQGWKRSILKKLKTKKSSAARVETIDFQKNKSSAMGMRGSCPPIHPPTPLCRGGPYPRYELQSTFNRAPLRQRNIRGPCPRALSEGIFVEKGTLKFVPRVRPAAVMRGWRV